MGLAGCQSYERKPLDLSAYRETLIGRSTDAPEVAEFARSLAANEPQSAMVYDPSDGLSLPEAEAVALVFNPDLRQARLRAGVALAVADTAGLWEDPVLGTDLTRIIQNTQYPWKSFNTVAFTIPISGRLEIEKQRAGAAHAAEVVRVYQAEWETRTALRKVWAEWTAAGQRLESAREFVTRLDQVVSIVDRLEKAGEMPRVDATLFRVEWGSRRAELAQLQAAVTESELTMKRLMGLAPDAPIFLVPGQMGRTERATIDLLQSWMAERNAAIAAAKAEYEIAERSLELEVRKQYPDLTIGPGYGYEDGQDQFLLNVAIPLPILNRNQQGIARARGERELSRAVYETTYERLLSELQSASVRHTAATTQRRALEDDLVPLVDRQYSDVRKTMDLGEVNALLLLETLKTQQQIKQRLIDARTDEHLAAIRLDELVGPEPAPQIGQPNTTGVQP